MGSEPAIAYKFESYPWGIERLAPLGALPLELAFESYPWGIERKW